MCVVQWCGGIDESHLFLNVLFPMLSMELSWVCGHWMSTSFIYKFRKLALAVFRYFIWKAKNLVQFQNENVSAIAIVGQIIDTVWYIRASWRYEPKVQENWSLIVEWDIFHIFLCRSDNICITYSSLM